MDLLEELLQLNLMNELDSFGYTPWAYLLIRKKFSLPDDDHTQSPFRKWLASRKLDLTRLIPWKGKKQSLLNLVLLTNKAQDLSSWLSYGA